MNWRINNRLKKLQSKWLICMGISAFFITSCDDPNEIGLDNQDDLVGITYTDTVTVNTKTVFLNNIQSQGITVILAGAYQDSYVGDVEATSFFQYRPTSDNPDFGTNAVCDSVELVLDYSAYFYGDTTATQTLEVYESDTQMYSDTVYLTSQTLGTKATLLGSVTTSLRPLGEDSLVIELSNTFGQSLLDNAPSYSIEDFVANFKGLALKNQNSSYGAVVGFVPSGSFSYLKVYYHNDGGNATYSFDMNDGYPKYNNITPTFSGSLASLTSYGDSLATSSTNNLGYWQAGTGLATKVEFPYLGELKKTNSNISINKAELVLYSEDNSNLGEHSEPPLYVNLFPITSGIEREKDDNGLDVSIANWKYVLGEIAFIEYPYDVNQKAYVLDVTGYIQDLITENKDNNGVIIEPAFVNATRVSRFVFYDNKNTDNPDKALQLRIYYTSPQ